MPNEALREVLREGRPATTADRPATVIETADELLKRLCGLNEMLDAISRTIEPVPMPGDADQAKEVHGGLVGTLQQAVQRADAAGTMARIIMSKLGAEM